MISRLFHRTGWIPVLLAGATFANTVPGDFVFDDTLLVEDDPGLKRFDLHRIFRQNYWGTTRQSPNYRPLTLLSYAVNYRLSARPRAFHAVNVLLHVAVVAVLYRIARLLFPSRWVAAGAACLFAALPIHTEAVANIVGRAELLAALGLFSAWWLALAQRGRERPGLAAGVGALVLLGMLAKESAAVAVALIPLSVFLVHRRVAWWNTGFAAAGVAAYFLLRYLALRAEWKLMVDAGAIWPAPGLVDNPLARQPDLTRVLNALLYLGLYAWRTVVPWKLSADHSYDELPVLPTSSALLWIGAAAVFLALAAPIVFHRRRPVLALAWLVFPICFAATANVFFPIGTIFGERLAYVPSAAYPLALGAVLAGVASTAGRRRQAIALLAALTIAYSARSWVRNEVWADTALFDVRLAQDAPRSTRARTKAAEGHVLLARRSGSADECARHLALASAEIAEALRIYPDNAGALAFRALIENETGRFADAYRTLAGIEQAFSREGVELDVNIHYLRGEVLYNLGRYEEAERSTDLYMSRRGPVAKALNLRGLCRIQRNASDLADQDLSQAIALDPANAVSHMNKGILMAQLGRVPEARVELDAAVRLAPDNPRTYQNRGYLRFQEKDLAGALADYRAGLELCQAKGLLGTPGNPGIIPFRQSIFDVLLQSGDQAGALRELEALRALGPRAAWAVKNCEAKLQSP